EDVRLSLHRAQSRGRVVLVVDVSERGTIIINELFLGSSEATPVWAGFDIGENNFLGHGIALSTGFVVGAQADVPGAQTQQAYRVRIWDPDLRGTGVGLGGELLLGRGSDFFRAQGADSSSRPADFVALGYRRVGGMIAAGLDVGSIAHLRFSHRGEW